MNFFSQLSRRFSMLLQRERFQSELDEEMQTHLAMQAEEEGGDAGRRQFGNATLLAEESLDVWGWGWLERLGQDLRFAFRMMRKSPGFAATAIASLALGIGANTVVFSAVNALMLRPLPVEAPEQVVSVNHNEGPAQSHPNYRDIRDRNTVFSSLFMYRMSQMSLPSANGAAHVWGYLVTGNYFESLGIQPALGRFFTPREERGIGASPYAVLSYGCWQNRFGGDPGVVGRVIRVNAHSYTVLGVAPRGFHGTEHFFWPEVWIPLSMQPQIEGPSNPWLESRNAHNGWVAGRLKPGVTLQQAGANLDSIAQELAREHRVNEKMKLSLSPMGFAGGMGNAPVSAFGGAVMLLALVVLVAACFNIASLLSARLTDRGRELAIRLSIGAGRGRIVRQLLTESQVLSLAGGVAGAGLAVFLLGMLSRWRAPLDFPIQFDVTPDWRVFAFSLAAALLTGAIFGALPAFRAWRSDPNGVLRNTDGGGATRWAVRDVLLAVQVALCCLLVTASLVAVRGLQKSFRIPLGFQPAGAAIASYELALAGYAEEKGRQFHTRALELVKQVPGVESAAIASSVPLSIDQSSTGLYPEDAPTFTPRFRISATYYRVSPSYFKTMGTRLLEGREFLETEGPGAPHVAILNETLARKVLGDGPWVGRRFRWDSMTTAEVVGVVEDGHYTTLTEDRRAVVFQPILRYYSSSALLIARSARPETEIAGELRKILASLDPDLPAHGAGSLTQLLGLAYFPANAAVISLGSFGVLAMMLAVSGVYGLSAYGVAQRGREIGIRMAVGAGPWNVLRLVFSRTAMLVALGSAAGLVLAAAGARVMASIVIGASDRDPVVLGAAALTMAAIGCCAAWGPASRALRVDPVRALRQD